MNPTPDDLTNWSQRLDDLVAQERVARRRSVLYAIVPLLAGLLWLAASFYEVHQLKSQASLLQRSIDVKSEEVKKARGDLESLQAEINLNKGLVNNAPVRTDRSLNREGILQSITEPRRRKVVDLAIQLYEEKIPYKFGGKSPQEGFDTSGYVAYILSQVGVIGNPREYWSGRLRDELPPAPAGKDEPGDIIFYGGGPCMIYLGGGLSIGSLPGGIATGNLDGSYPRIGVARVPAN